MNLKDGITIAAQVVSHLPVEKWFVRYDKKKTLDGIEKRVTKDTIPKPGVQDTESVSQVPSVPGVSDQETLNYQLNQVIDDCLHLEEHLSQKGRLFGKSCDCISKSARDARRHALETIPIASRQGKDGAVFSTIASWAEGLIPIGTPEAVESGKYDDRYLKEAGTASSYRKQVQVLQSVWIHKDMTPRNNQ